MNDLLAALSTPSQVTIVSNGWTNVCGEPIISHMFGSPEGGAYFHLSEVSDSHPLARLNDNKRHPQDTEVGHLAEWKYAPPSGLPSISFKIDSPRTLVHPSLASISRQGVLIANKRSFNLVLMLVYAL